MFILLAAVVFLLALLHVQLGDVNMIALGLFLLALGLLIPWSPFPWPARSGPPA
jgi:hypothetical protein